MNRCWNVLDWNIRGVNSQERWGDISIIRQRSEESNSNIICLQETKREIFDHTYINCPKIFSHFVYSPSVGNSGGITTIWNGSVFGGKLIYQSKF
jgi:exonuclease III